MTTHFLVKKTDLSQTTGVVTDAVQLEDGQLRLRVEKFGLTANNITYGLLGDMMQYWGFFPAPNKSEDGLGVIPMWGFAVVAESAHPQFREGMRFYGYLPPADSFVLEPSKVTGRGFEDCASHRPTHASIYNNYQRIDGSTGMAMTDAQECIYMLLWPLFATAFLIDAYLANNDGFGAKQVVFLSASSRTAIATAAQVAKRAEQRVLGVTSATNKAFVESLGYYDQVVSYDELEQLDNSLPTVSVDMSGNSQVLSAVHQHFGQQLKFSSMVGATHQSMGDSSGLAAPKPELFFAPDQLSAFSKRWGAAEFQQRLFTAWLAYAKSAGDWLELVDYQGHEGLEVAYQLVLSGKSKPSQGAVVRLLSDNQ